MSTRTSIRSRVSIVACASLLTVWSVAQRSAAQDSPEFGAEEEAAAPEEGLDESAPVEAEPMPMPMEEAPAEAPRGYSDSAPTAAELLPAEEAGPAPLAPSVRVAAEVAFFSEGADDTEGSHLSISPLFGVGLGISDSLEAGVSWGLSYQDHGAPEGAMSQEGENAFVIGNPTLSLTQHTQKGETFFSFGGSVAIPLASLPDAAEDIAITAAAYQYAAALRGNWNQWLWAPDRASAAVHFASHAVLDELLFGGEAAAAALIPTDKGDMAVAGQLAGEVGFATETVRVVLRVQGVATVTPGLEDPFQVSLDPYVTWNASAATTLSARLTVNADNPAGVEGAGVWALRVGANIGL